MSPVLPTEGWGEVLPDLPLPPREGWGEGLAALPLPMGEGWGEGISKTATDRNFSTGSVAVMPFT